MEGLGSGVFCLGFGEVVCLFVLNTSSLVLKTRAFSEQELSQSDCSMLPLPFQPSVTISSGQTVLPEQFQTKVHAPGSYFFPSTTVSIQTLPRHCWGIRLPLSSPALLGKKCCKLNARAAGPTQSCTTDCNGGIKPWCFAFSPVWGGPVLLLAVCLASNLVL